MRALGRVDVDGAWPRLRFGAERRREKFFALRGELYLQRSSFSIPSREIKIRSWIARALEFLVKEGVSTRGWKRTTACFDAGWHRRQEVEKFVVMFLRRRSGRVSAPARDSARELPNSLFRRM
jgi:hypothetical protein